MGGSYLKELKDYITNIPDFPQKGIIFRDVTSLLQSGKGFSSAVDEMLGQLDDVEFDAVLGLEARGFLFGAPIAYARKKSFVPVRKKGKLPRATVSAEYDLEYGKAEIEIHTDSLKKGDKVTLVGFGTYETRKRAARTGKNPQTGEAIKIKAAKVPAFKPGKALKDAVNGAK